MSHPHALRDLALFVEVAKRKSFSRAAAALDMPISSLSRRISLFESELGLRLIERTTRRLVLTRDGAAYLPRIAKLVEEAEQTVADLLAQGRGEPATLTVEIPPEAWLLRHLPRLIADADPTDHIRLNLAVFCGGEAPAAERADLVVTVAPHGEPPEGFVTVGAIETGLYASPGYLDGHAPPVRPEDLASHSLIRQYGAAPAPWHLRAGEEAVVVSVAGRFACDGADLSRRLAQAGLGIVAAGAPDVAEDLREGRLRRVLPGWHLPPRSVHVAKAGHRLSTEANGLADRLVEGLATLLSRGAEATPGTKRPVSGAPTMSDLD